MIALPIEKATKMNDLEKSALVSVARIVAGQIKTGKPPAEDDVKTLEEFLKSYAPKERPTATFVRPGHPPQTLARPFGK